MGKERDHISTLSLSTESSFMMMSWLLQVANTFGAGSYEERSGGD